MRGCRALGQTSQDVFLLQHPCFLKVGLEGVSGQSGMEVGKAIALRVLESMGARAVG